MLKDQIKIVYQKHVHDDVSEAANVDQDIQKEYARQRDHLEKTVNSLKYKLSKDSEIHKNDNIRIMQVMINRKRKLLLKNNSFSLYFYSKGKRHSN